MKKYETKGIGGSELSGVRVIGILLYLNYFVVLKVQFNKMLPPKSLRYVGFPLPSLGLELIIQCVFHNPDTDACTHSRKYLFQIHTMPDVSTNNDKSRYLCFF